MERKLCKPVDIAQARKIAGEQPEEESLVTLLVRLGIVSERTMADCLSGAFGLPLRKPADFASATRPEGAITPRFLKDQHVLPMVTGPGKLELVMTDPTARYPYDAVVAALDCDPDLSVGIAGEILTGIEHLYGSPEGAEEKAGQPLNDEMDVSHLRDLASEAPVIRWVNQVIQKAVETRASDIHIEPFENKLKVRFRIDGVLRDESAPSHQTSQAIISRIKIMAALDIAERRLPQDGRINLRIQGDLLDIRVSTIPTMFGESVVMRLLRQEAAALDFDSLGFSDEQQRLIQRGLTMSHGMMIVTGPTGSGKTTTLYTALNAINVVDRKVITVEDPIEYHIDGINQIQVNSAIGLGFAETLRSIVRQDPDVIMVGEIRDLQAAKISIQSALTGHLVLSTLHTNDAASCVTRLLEMGIEDYLLTSTLTIVIAQRLVRQLCPRCKTPYQASETQVREFQLNRFSGGRHCQLFQAVGCEECNETGYRGRVAILEILMITEKIRELILDHVSSEAILKAAREEGMVTMVEDGYIKALAGVTTVEEVLRVTREA